MNAAVLERPMGKKRGRPASGKPWNEGKPVRLEAGMAAKARAIATDRGITIGEYFTEIANTKVDKDYAALLRKLEGGDQ